LGRPDEAVAILGQASELAKTVPDYATQVEAGGELGRCYLCQGKLEEALSALQTSQQVCDEHRAGWGTSTPLRNGLAEAYLVAAEQGTRLRPSAGGAWLGRARRACREALKQGKAFRPGLPEAMRLRGTYEWLRGKPAAADKWWRRGLALAEEMGQPYDSGLIHLEMGKRLGERAHLERAEALLSEVGAAWDLARARELLAAGG
jgi:hypothetical protein